MRSRKPGSFGVAILLTTGCAAPTTNVSISCGEMATDSAEVNTYVQINLDQIAAASPGSISVELTQTEGGSEVQMRVDRRLGWETATCPRASQVTRIFLTGGRVSNGVLRITTPSPARVVVLSDGTVVAEHLYDPTAPSAEPLEWPRPE